MSIPAKAVQLPTANTIEDVLIKGDLSKLTERQRTEYYMRVCQSIGLNPMTKPFSYLTLNGKLVLYATRDCADQLRKIHGISIEILSQDKADGLLTVHVRAKDRDGRMDEDLGVVAFGDHLKGEIAANTILKAVTKAKRRVTLSLAGLGFLDETEAEDIPAAAKQAPANDKVITQEQADEINTILSDAEPKVKERLLKLSDASSVDAILAVKFDAAMTFLNKYAKADK